jgi:hypothetical protein
MVETAIRKAPSWATRLLLPDIGEMKGDIKSLDTRITEMDKRHTTNIDALRNEIRSEFKVMHTKLDSIAKDLDTQREIAILKTKVAELEKRK